MASMSLSQVIYAVRDLDQATATAQSLGFTVVDGGRHPGLGTANRLIPLGDSYVELLAVVDAAEAAASSYGRAVLDRTRERDTLVRWSLRTDDLEKVARERGLEPEHRERRRSDGELVTWRAAGLELSLREGWLPFFMQWDRPEQYPGATDVVHENGASAVAWLELAPGDIDRLSRWIGAARPPLRLVDGEPGLRRGALTVAGGTLVLPTDWSGGDSDRLRR